MKEHKITDYEIIEPLFPYIEPVDKVSFSEVSKACNFFVKKKAHHLKVNQYISEEDFISLIQENLRVTSLDLSFCSKLTVKAIQFLSDNLPNLRSLSLRFCAGISKIGDADKAFYALSQLTGLQHLNLKMVKKFTHKGVQYLQSLTQLKDLQIFYQSGDYKCMYAIGSLVQQLELSNNFFYKDKSRSNQKPLKCLENLCNYHKEHDYTLQYLREEINNYREKEGVLISSSLQEFLEENINGNSMSLRS